MCQAKFCFPKLRIFDLSRNEFSGSLPEKVFGNFKAMIKLDDVDTREIKYMESKSNLSFDTSYEDSVSLVIKGKDIELQRISTIMTTIDLSSNHFEALDLSWNWLTGKIPQELARMNFLTFLNVSQNHLVGPIPHGLQFNTFENDSYGGNLDLCGPPLSKKCETSGSSHVPQPLEFEEDEDRLHVPCPLESEEEEESYFASGFTWQSVVIVVVTVMWSLMFKVLQILDLSRNEFSGSLPAKVFGNLKAMIELEGEDTGEIKYMEPSKVSPNTLYEDSVNLVIKGNDIELERISTIMTTIDLSSNHFEGVIPKTLKNLGSLWQLNLSHNNLKGHIPMQLRKLNKLEALDLSWNRLTGKIPQELTRMNFLAFLNLSQNHLVGPIPQGPQFNTFGNDSYGGNLDLCGLPLSKQCGTSDSSHVPQPLESTEEDESYFLVDLPGNQ
ncbi:receptor-like protein 9DC1 [Solanum stenotomum]|uniref:receptor-like protein 9DC1 n=1 Tax=Solanum stenotomum TaxID=172797 RepID=UPI0020D1D8D4|nr:receptor-like protein 9DC1 [Solanum stenotomum]